MQKKLCIVPEKRNILRELTQGIELTQAEQKIFFAAVVKHVEVSLEGNSWEILLQTQEVIRTGLLERVGDYIKKQAHIEHLVFYQDILDVEASIERAWKELCLVAANGNPSVLHLLKTAKRIFDGANLRIEVKGELSGEILRAHDVPNLLQKAIEKMLTIRCAVSYKAVDEEYIIPEEDRELAQDRAYEENLRQKKETPAVASPAAQPKKTAAASAHRSASMTRTAGHGADLIFGKRFTGEAISIDDTDGEMKSVILTGSVGRISSREFKTKTKLLLFDLADSTNGISCT